MTTPKVIPFFTTESDPNQLATLQLLIAEYQRFHPNIEIDIVVASPSSRGRRLLIALASGADLGIFEIEPTFMTDWAEAGYLLPLNDVVAKIGAEDYMDGSLFVYDKQVYAIPYATSVYTLWVRTDLFAQAGLAFPTTYDEVLQAAETLTHGEIYGIALPNGQNNATTNYFSTFLWQNGGDYFDCAGHVTFGEPTGLIAVKKWADLSQYSPPGSTTWGYGEQIDAYLRGRVAMVMYAGRLGVNITDKAPELADKSVVLFPPWGPEQVTLGVWSRFAIASGTRHRDEAKEFLQWLVSGDRLLRYDMAVPGHMIPPLESVREKSLEYDLPYVNQHQDWLTSFYDWVPYTNHPAMNMGSVSNGRFLRSDNVPPWSSVVFDSPGIVDTMLQQITLGGRDPEEAWGEAVDKMEMAVSEWQTIHPNWVSPTCQQ
ncbi:MAG: sugar ABC transporter substrate-binding protein [Chloroflexi bacterium]|nr:sugar ABC transporter substrate-binding protein [Chloroflexota bacterium]